MSAYARDRGNGKNRWFRDGLRFQCRSCTYCCRGEPGYVWVTPLDLKRIAAFLGTTCAEVSRKSLAEVRRRGPEGTRWSLKERGNGDCAFLAGGKCTIYKVRPRQCRTYPFWKSVLKSKRHWEREAKYCPGIGAGKLFGADEIIKLEKHF